MATGGINLAPSNQHALQSRRRNRRLWVLTFILIILLAAAWVGLTAYQQQQAARQEDLNNQLRNIRTEIAKLEGESGRIKSFEHRLIALDQLLDNHLTWNSFFTDLEAVLPADVIITSLETGSQAGSLSISAETANIDRVAVALATLSRSSNPDSIFTDGRISSVDPVEEVDPETEEVTRKVEFSAELAFDLSRIRPGS